MRHGLLSAPSIDNKNNIAFVYANNLYLYNAALKNVIQLTTQGYIVTSTSISHNGLHIAFSSRATGYDEIFLYSLHDASIKRITYYCASSFSVSWKSENIFIFSTNAMSTHLSPHQYTLCAYNIQTHTVSYQVEKMNPCYATFISYYLHGNNKNQKHILQTNGYGYCKFGEYKGGAASRIWYEKRMYLKHDPYNHERPHMLDNNIYYMSCKQNDGVGALYMCEQVVAKHDYYITHLCANEQYLVYASGGDIYMHDPKNHQSIKIDITLPLVPNREIFLPLNKRAHYSINANSMVSTVSYGQMFIQHAYKPYKYSYHITEKENNTLFYRLSCINNNKTYAVGFDDIKEYIDIYDETYTFVKRLNCIDANDKIISIIATEHLLVCTTQSYKLIIIDCEHDTCKEVDYSQHGRILHASISKDSKWIAYTKPISMHHYALMLYDVVNSNQVQITDNDCYEFSSAFGTINKQECLFFLSGKQCSTSYADLPGYPSINVERTMHPFVLYLNSNASSLFIEPMNHDHIKEDKQKSEVSDDKTESSSICDNNQLVVEIEHIQNRIEPFKIDNLDKLEHYEIYALHVANNTVLISTKSAIYKFDFVLRKLTKLSKGKIISINSNGVMLLEIRIDDNKDRTCIQYFDLRNDISTQKQLILNINACMQSAKYYISLLREAHRAQLDACVLFKDEHNRIEWYKLLTEYLKLAYRASSERDIYNIIYEMLSRMYISHAYLCELLLPSEKYYTLGIEYELSHDGKYIISKKYDTDQAHIGLSLDINRFNIPIGSTVTSINGIRVDKYNTPEKLCINQNIVSAVINDREYILHTNPNIHEIRYTEWIKNNTKIALENNILYIHIPNMSSMGYAKFLKSFYVMCSKYIHSYQEPTYCILDLRYNGGGHASSEVLSTILRATRQPNGYDTPRHSQNLKIPYLYGAFNIKFAVVITNQHCGSDGDMMTYMCKALKQMNIKVIGTRTWGGIVGITNMDCLFNSQLGVYKPEFPFEFTDRTEPSVENYGVDPHIEVIQSPYTKEDIQLAKAIKLVQQMMDKNKK